MPSDGREYLQPHNPLTRAPIVPPQACEPAMRAAELDAETQRDRDAQEACYQAVVMVREKVGWKYPRQKHPWLHALLDIAFMALDQVAVYVMRLDHKRSQEQKES